MKQYTSPEQTAKLIASEFEKPRYECFDRTLRGIEKWDNIQRNYSIGELIEMLPKHIEIESEWCRLDIYPTKNKWYVNYENIVFESPAKTYEIELIDALYDMIIRLKEEGVI